MQENKFNLPKRPSNIWINLLYIIAASFSFMFDHPLSPVLSFISILLVHLIDMGLDMLYIKLIMAQKDVITEHEKMLIREREQLSKNLASTLWGKDKKNTNKQDNKETDESKI